MRKTRVLEQWEVGEGGTGGQDRARIYRGGFWDEWEVDCVSGQWASMHV